ncbi:hypothetical protein [Thalassobaculum litoreum]|uniref:Uncharacterized protein n=1 Tax=Thalassobaculum litoreum DSM 18839 TaxID=1123362 RepID=A0A8G2BJF4_9PROT|nr:hypothetical protein [Thalassobaculum litoreum]SDF82931.1 hypothetical protein SAMN05660686_02442 [Thalassobaculum litoreum DSM 18839]
MKPYVLQEWSGRGEFLGCEAFDTMPAVEKSLFLWIQMMASKGYELAPFPGGVVACKRDAWGRSQPEMMAIIEPQRPAVTGAAIPDWIRAPVGAPDDPNPVRGVVR